MRVTNSTKAPETSDAGGRSFLFLWVMWLIWLPFLIPTTVDWLHTHPSAPRLVATLVAVVFFACFYTWASWQIVRRLVTTPPLSAYLEARATTVVFIVLSVTIALLGGEHGGVWLAPFIYTSAYVSGCFPPRWALPLAGFLLLLILAIGQLDKLDGYAVGQAVFLVTTVSIVVICVSHVFRTSGELRIAREEIARLAVTAERLRIARDLHDLLGHNLSLIALKSELAKRLVGVAPERVTTEIEDIEQVARTTLQEVREAVASYRQPTLASELHAAQEILAAAGIAYRYKGDEHVLSAVPQSSEMILAWTVREGVTNVIRHSRAHYCLVCITRDTQELRVEVINDGLSPACGYESAGNGLRGLAERVKALDGQFEAGPVRPGGFRLAVTLPVAGPVPGAVTDSGSSRAGSAETC